MEERRKSKRMELEAKLMVKRLDSTEKHAVVINITDVSRTGVGFSCRISWTSGQYMSVTLPFGLKR